MNLYEVPSDVFEKYVEDNKLRRIDGNWFHSFDYVNDEGIIMAQFISSSWSPLETFKIADDGYCNFEALSYINRRFNL